MSCGGRKDSACFPIGISSGYANIPPGYSETTTGSLTRPADITTGKVSKDRLKKMNTKYSNTKI